jgi:HK97 family phage portal protein
MGLWSWLQGKMLGGKTVEISADTVEKYVDQEKAKLLTTTEFEIHAAINLIANCISKCEFRTYEQGKETKSWEHYAWNYEPNKNQNSSQFLQELVTRLLYYNECLIVESGGQLIIAESFVKEEFCLKETVFRSVYREGLTFDRDFYMSDVYYFRLNNRNIRSLLTSLCAGYSELLSEAVDKYEKAGGEKGTLKIDAAATGMKYGSRTFEEVYEDLMNERFKKFFNSRSAVLPLFNGFNYTKQAAEQSKKSTSEMKDITDVVDEITETVARAFNIPVALLKGDVSDVEKITRNFLTFCIDPICEMIQTEINRKRYGRLKVIKGNYVKIDTTTVMHTDVFDVAESADKLIASGMYCIDELRRKLGDQELGTEEAQKHWITKNYETLEGG